MNNKEEKRNGTEETNDREQELKKYENIISVWKRLDESYWSSVHMYIIIMGLLLAGFSQMIDKSTLLLFIYCCAGIIISLIWILILHKKMSNTYIAEEVARDLEEETFVGLEYRGVFTRTKYTYYHHDNSKEEKKWSKWRKEFLIGHFGKRQGLTNISSAKLVSYYFPLFMWILWIVIFVVVIY